MAFIYTGLHTGEGHALRNFMSHLQALLTIWSTSSCSQSHGISLIFPKVFNGFPSQCVKANKTLCGLAPLTSPITSSPPALPTQFQLYVPPGCPSNMPGIFLLCLCSRYSLCLAFSCPDIHMDHSLRSLLQNHLCNEAFPTYPHENAAIFMSHIFTSLFSLHCT